MTRFRTILLALVVGWAGPASAAPFSENALACEAHLLWMADQTSNPDVAPALARFASAFGTAAREQALIEGQPSPDAYLARLADAKAAEWARHGQMWVFTSDFRDWNGYCNRFAEALGIDPKAYRPPS
ncbi:MAG: hypothetical protein AAF919_19140 [Pseudomonadota bacterium]